MKDEWVMIDNPAYLGRTPTPLKAECHDGTPFVTIACSHCGFHLHQHESRVEHIPDDAEVTSACPHCGRLLVFPPGFFRDAFRSLREQGWIDEN